MKYSDLMQFVGANASKETIVKFVHTLYPKRHHKKQEVNALQKLAMLEACSGQEREALLKKERANYEAKKLEQITRYTVPVAQSIEIKKTKAKPSNGPKLPKSAVVVLTGNTLTEMRQYAKLAQVDLETYVITSALSYPRVLTEIHEIQKLAQEAGLFDNEPTEGASVEPQATVSAGTSEADTGKEG